MFTATRTGTGRPLRVPGVNVHIRIASIALRSSPEVASSERLTVTSPTVPSWRMTQV